MPKSLKKMNLYFFKFSMNFSIFQNPYEFFFFLISKNEQNVTNKIPYHFFFYCFFQKQYF